MSAPRWALLVGALLGAATVASCGGDDGAKPIDAQPIDAPLGNAAVPATCDGTESATIITMDGIFAFMPDTATISVGQMVKFQMAASHSVVSDPTGGDPGLSAAFGEPGRCIKFVRAGTYKFHCAAHAQMHGTITVNP